MNLIKIYAKVFSLCIVLLFISCNKKKPIGVQEPIISTELANGLGQNPNSINGYFYASQKDFGFSSISNSYYASISDPKRKLTTGYNHFTDNSNFSTNNTQGNIDVGLVLFNNSITLTKTSFNPTLIYGSNNSSSFFTTNAYWKTDGNGSFKPLDLIISRGFPTMVSNATLAPVSKSSGYTINLSAYTTNYDSLIVSINDNGGNTIKKLLDGTSTSVTFSTNELSSLYTTSNGSVLIYAFNYSNKTIENKNYIFELSSKISRYVYINP